MNVTSENATCDFFSGLIENRPSKIIFMSVSLLLMLVSIVLSYSIIWYERFGIDAKRTILNQIFALQWWTAIECIIFVTFLEWLGFILSPAPKTLCWVHFVIKHSIITKVFLLHTGLIIARYMCIFFLKNPAAFNDEFWCRFIHIWINAFSFLLHFTQAYLPGKQLISYYICSGVNPAIDSLLPPRFNYINHFLGFVGITVHLPMSIRIFWYKHKRSNVVIPLSDAAQSPHLKEIDKHSLTNFSSATVSLICMLFFAYLFSEYSKLEPADLNNYPNYFLVFWIQMIYAPLTVIVLLTLTYARNERLRKVMYRETKDFLLQLF